MRVQGVIMFLTVLLGVSFAYAQAEFPSAKTRVEMVSAMAAEMERLDGEALLVRGNRAKPWRDVISQLNDEAKAAQNWRTLSRVFARLDHSYPNLHSSYRPGKEITAQIPDDILLEPAIETEWIAADRVRHSISLKGKSREILAINGRSIEEWKAENFEFCKFPEKAQCDFVFVGSLHKEILSWMRDQEIRVRINVDGAPVEMGLRTVPAPPRKFDFAEVYCKLEPHRYPGFRTAYAGNRACVFQPESDPGLAVLRITSFDYSPDRLEPQEKITHVFEEIEALYPWWKAHARWEHLVIDLIDNHGGEAPVDYYAILFQEDFQEQYVRFKKTAEMMDADLRRSIFWDSRGQEIWFQKLVTDGIWDSLAVGEFTPPVPMFCANDQVNCAEGLFPTRAHDFRGKVSLMVNSWCVSSCDGFVYNEAEKLGARVFGHPQAADTAYSRLTLRLDAEEGGYKIRAAPLGYEGESNTLLTQTIVVTRSVRENGEVVSGKPVPVYEFVPRTLENQRGFPAAVLARALAR